MIEQMEGDDLILGLAGEKLRKDRGFYAVFRTAQEYAILCGGQSLGKLEILPRKDEHLLFAGRRWRVTQIDDQRREVHVEPAKGYKRPRFTGGAGEVHPRIRQKMREVLANGRKEVPVSGRKDVLADGRRDALADGRRDALADGRNDVLADGRRDALADGRPYAYLDDQAASLLADARAAARSARICEDPFVSLRPHRTAVMTWTGTRIQDTLEAMLAFHGVQCENEGIALVLKLPPADARAVLADLAHHRDDPLKIAAQIQPRQRRKYDYLLGEELLNTCLARGWLDLDGAAAVLSALLDERNNKRE